MLSETTDLKVINKGFKVQPKHFDLGPGTSLQDGEELINAYFWNGAPDPELKDGQPLLTLGFTKESAAKLIYCFIRQAREYGWIVSGVDDDEDDGSEA